MESLGHFLVLYARVTPNATDHGIFITHLYICVRILSPH